MHGRHNHQGLSWLCLSHRAYLGINFTLSGFTQFPHLSYGVGGIACLEKLPWRS